MITKRDGKTYFFNYEVPEFEYNRLNSFQSDIEIRSWFNWVLKEISSKMLNSFNLEYGERFYFNDGEGVV